MNLFREWSDLTEDERNVFLRKLGPLAHLVGVWEGVGFTVISRPSAQPSQIFQFATSKTLETLSIIPLILSVKNRGEDPQQDITLNGLLYKQGIVDAENITQVLHFESGQWLFVPITQNPDSKATIVRQAAILHGSAFTAVGEAPSVAPECHKPTISPTDTTPILLTGGPLDDKYLKPITTTQPPHGFPSGCVKDPNIILNSVLSAQEVLDFVEFHVSAKLHFPSTPDLPNTDAEISPGISNIPFLDQNAQVREIDSTFYVEHIEDCIGISHMQLQYTQRVILRFAGLDWPHVSVATLRRVLL